MATLEELQEQVKELTLKNQQKDVLLDSMRSIKDNYSKLREFLMKKGLDPDTNPEDGWTSIIGQKEQKAKTLEQQLAELTGKFNDLNKQLEGERREKQNFEIKNKLKGKMTDVIAADDLIELMILQNKVALKGEDVVYKKSENEELKFDDFFSDFKTKNPDRIRAGQQNGNNNNKDQNKTNTNNNNGSGKTIKYDEYLKLDAAAQEKVVTENVTIEY